MGRGKVIKSLQREIIIKVKKIIIINIMKYWKKGILDVCMRTASYCPQIVYNQGDTTKGHHGILRVWPAALVIALLLQPFHSNSHPLKN